MVRVYGGAGAAVAAFGAAAGRPDAARS